MLVAGLVLLFVIVMLLIVKMDHNKSLYGTFFRSREQKEKELNLSKRLKKHPYINAIIITRRGGIKIDTNHPDYIAYTTSEGYIKERKRMLDAVKEAQSYRGFTK